MSTQTKARGRSSVDEDRGPYGRPRPPGDVGIISRGDHSLFDRKRRNARQPPINDRTTNGRRGKTPLYDEETKLFRGREPQSYAAHTGIDTQTRRQTYTDSTKTDTLTSICIYTSKHLNTYSGVARKWGEGAQHKFFLSPPARVFFSFETGLICLREF